MKNNFNLFTLTLIGLIFFTGCKNSANNNSAIKSTANNSAANNLTNKDLVNNKIDNASNVVTVTNNANKSTAPAGPQVESKLDAANFDKLEKGMKYADVVKAFGSEGKIISDGEFAGVRTVMYEWRGAGGSFAKVVFQNDKLYDKAHTGLR